MMELNCIEIFDKEEYAPERTAKRDPVIFDDIRVLNNLLNEEVFYIPNCNYFQTVQNEIEPFMRKIVTTWMLEVCEEQLCEDQILPLAVNVMDRFLCVCVIKKQQFQLLGATCLLIASKLRSTTLLPVDLLCAYTDHSVTYTHIIQWELLVLSKLNWNISAVTGFDYIDHVLERYSWGRESNLLRRHAHTLVSICYTEPSLIQTPPSVIAAGCLSSAARGLKMSSSEVAVRDICATLNVSTTTVEYLVGVIDNAVAKVEPPAPEKPAPAAAAQPAKTVEGYESPTYGQPETPTEVENIYF